MAREILRDTVITGAMGIAGSLFTYLFLLFLGKSLSPVEFSDFSLVLSSLILLSVISMIYNAVVVRFIAYFSSKSQKDKIVTFSKRSLYTIILFGISLFLLSVLFDKQVESFFNVNSPFLIPLIGLFILADFCAIGFGGILNGLQRFAILGFARIVQTIVILGVGVFLVKSGFGVSGALGGLIAGSIMVCIICFLSFKKSFFVQPSKIGKAGVPKYLFFAIPIALSLGVLINADLLIAKYYLPTEEAGLYAAATVIGVISFFIMISVVRVMFPKVADFFENGKDSLVLLKEGLQYTLAMTGALTLAIVLFPTLASRLLFAKNYLISDLLRWYAPSTFFLSISSVIVMYLLATKKYAVVIPTLCFAVAKIALLLKFHSSAIQIAQLLFWLNGAMLLLILLFYKDTVILALRKRKDYFDYTDLLEYYRS